MANITNLVLKPLQAIFNLTIIVALEAKINEIQETTEIMCVCVCVCVLGLTKAKYLVFFIWTFVVEYRAVF